MARYGFEARNQSNYRLVCGLGLATSALVAGTALLGRRPDWMVDGILPVVAFGMAGLVCLIALRAMPAAGHFRFAALGASVLAVGLACLGSGGQLKLAWIMVVAGAGAILVPVLLGRNSDRQTPEKSLRIPWPWR